MKATVSEKGQVTIPKSLRTKLGIKTGSVLEFDARGGTLVARKAELIDPVDAAWGILSLGESVDAFIDRARGPRGSR
jgi:AbrB family looped-hinge helix DNA binding protein